MLGPSSFAFRFLDFLLHLRVGLCCVLQAGMWLVL
jgi:hypothetical protein